MDKLLFTDEQKPLAQEIMDSMGTATTISIGGLSGTGKTEIAHLLKDLLAKVGDTVKILSQDDFYLPGHEERRKESIGYVGAEEIDWHRLERSIQNIINCRAYNILIVEGLYSILASTDYKVYINQNYKSSEAFRKKRGKENPDCEFRQQVLERERRDIERTSYKADIILKY